MPLLRGNSVPPQGGFNAGPPAPPPPTGFPALGASSQSPFFGNLPQLMQPGGLQGKSIPQWLRDVVREAGSKKGARDGKEGEEEEGGQLFTPSSKGAQSPRDASPAAAKDPMEKDSEGTSQPLLVEQIKEVVTEILSAVTDEIFREAAREAISNQRRKQRITGKTTIGLKLQGAGAANETDFQKEQSQQAEGNVATGFRKREDQEKLSSGVVNSDALAVGAYRCPSSATPPPPGVFSIVIYEDGLEFARVPFNGTHLLFGTSNKFANIIDSHSTVAGQQCAIYFSTRQLHQQGGCFFMVPLGGATRLLHNKTVPFLPQTIKEELALRKSRRSVSSYISKNKEDWINWAPSPIEGSLLSAGDERVALTDQRSCFVMGDSRRVYYLDLTDMAHRLLVAEGKAEPRPEKRKERKHKNKRKRSHSRQHRRRRERSSSRKRSRHDSTSPEARSDALRERRRKASRKSPRRSMSVDSARSAPSRNASLSPPARGSSKHSARTPRAPARAAAAPVLLQAEAPASRGVSLQAATAVEVEVGIATAVAARVWWEEVKVRVRLQADRLAEVLAGAEPVGGLAAAGEAEVPALRLVSRRATGEAAPA
ncbi:hypothetical protein cyc_06897 [Cyclospora cayetanensis]|uniref:Uncharacterized protein n=1 Tax=Cyclospora cayetanensis TaxID=88456 RepID=A0A1D3CUY2_9EIME|nr:hypothetical protein cyc_06897 [Cyclospora cayetanensis]